jgi:ferric-dicitrate binding protein FerR (iron transport regulator)
MDNSLNKVSALIIKHLEGARLTQAEQQELDAWLQASPQNQALFSKLTDTGYVRQELEKMYDYDAEAGWEKIRSAYGELADAIPMQRSSRWKYWVAAAVTLVAIAGAALLFLYFSGKNTKAVHTPVIAATDIPAPAISKATITLQNGKRMPVDSLIIGTTALQGEISVQKTADGQIVYTSDKEPTPEMRFNTLANPRGSRVIQLTLSDGTKVWLNAESEIRYPVAFTAGQRKVEIKGEAYFEVAKDAQKPFVVQSNGATVQVTGTHFNVNAYTDEPALRVTLLEGGVKVSKENNTVLLKPGEQAEVGGNIHIHANADIDQVMAWKNGIFSFNGTDIYTAMRQISRWYDVDIRFNDAIKENFYGDIPRNSNISGVLNMLETTGSVHFKTIGNMIEVYK